MRDVQYFKVYRISKRMPNMQPIGARKVNSNMHLSLKGNRIVQL